MLASELINRKTLNKIVLYLRNNISDIAKINATTISRNTEMSLPSVIRFFQANGFENFADFKFQYLAEIKNQDHEKEEFSNDYKSLTTIFGSNIERLFENNSKDKFKQVANLIANSKLVTIVGSGSSYGIAYELTQKLSELGLDCIAILGPVSNAARINNAGENHTLVIISYSMKHKAYNELVSNAKKANSKIILIHGEHVTKYSGRVDAEILVNKDDTNDSIILYSNIEFIIINYFIAHEIFELNINKYKSILQANKSM